VAHTADEIYASATSDFLRALVTTGSRVSDSAGEAVALCALAELRRRREKMNRADLFGHLQELLTSGQYYGVEAGPNHAPFELSAAFK
jgi:hypothetical protein